MFFEKRHTITILIFFSICFYVLNWAHRIEKMPDHFADKKVQKLDSQSRLRESYVLIWRDGAPIVNLFSQTAKIEDENNLITLVAPKGKYYRQDRIYDFVGDFGFLDNKKKHFNLSSNVQIKSEGLEAQSDEVNFYETQDEVVASGNVKTVNFNLKNFEKIFIQSESLMVWPGSGNLQYRFNVQGHIERARDYGPGLKFKTQLLDFLRVQQRINLEGSVYVERGLTKVQALRGEIHLENYNKTLKYYELFDDVRIEEVVPTRSGNVLRKGFAEHLEGHVAEDKLVLTGYPKVYQDKDVIKGNRIVVRPKSSIVEVDDASSELRLEKPQ
jgi:lipopolysaccharide export system protein LptA